MLCFWFRRNNQGSQVTPLKTCLFFFPEDGVETHHFDCFGNVGILAMMDSESFHHQTNMIEIFSGMLEVHWENHQIYFLNVFVYDILKRHVPFNLNDENVCRSRSPLFLWMISDKQNNGNMATSDIFVLSEWVHHLSS